MNGPIHTDGLNCWLWTASLNTHGYGQFWLDNRVRKAHTLAFLDSGRQIPDGYEPDHLCPNRHCIRPEHLEAVTHTINIQRGNSPSALHRLQTHCKRGHVFSRVDKRGKRICGKCAVIHSQTYQRKQSLT